MMPQSFSVAQGETLEELLATVDDFDEPIDLSTATLSFSCAREPGGDVVAGTDVSPPNATVDVAIDNGDVFLTIDAAATALMLGTYEWECRAEGPPEIVVARGYLTVTRAVAA